MKLFAAWFKRKEKLDALEYTPPHISEGDMWWCALGENVGVEIGGKNENFTRPVVVLKKFGALGFLAIPTTTKVKEGSWYVPFVHKGISETAVLSQARIVSYKRLDKKMGSIDERDFAAIKKAYIRLFD